MKENVLRINRGLFDQFANTARATSDESFAFATAVVIEGRRENIYLVRQLVMPDAGDLECQTRTFVSPARNYQGVAQLLACLCPINSVLLDFHTHPGIGEVGFSGIDIQGHTIDAEVARTCLPARVSTGSLVFDHSLDRFEGKVFIKSRQRYEPIHAVEIIGSPMKFLTARPSLPSIASPVYHRQTLIPGWDQDVLAGLKVVICGAGGIGNLIFSSLVSIGVGEKAWIAIVDPDRVEETNLSRLPCASFADIGKPKVRATGRYARFKGYKGKIITQQTGIQDPRLLPLIKEAHVLIGAADTDGPRKVLNEYSIRYGIPYIDFASEIFIDKEGKVDSGGQVRMVIPGQTGCLLCTGGIDMREAEWNLMSDEGKRAYERAGYIAGTGQSPAPAVNTINSVVVSWGVHQFVKMIFGQTGGQTDLYFQGEKNLFVGTAREPNPDCLLCGSEGISAAGDHGVTASKQALGGIKIIDSEKARPANHATHDAVRGEPV